MVSKAEAAGVQEVSGERGDDGGGPETGLLVEDTAAAEERDRDQQRAENSRVPGGQLVNADIREAGYPADEGRNGIEEDARINGLAAINAPVGVER